MPRESTYMYLKKILVRYKLYSLLGCPSSGPLNIIYIRQGDELQHYSNGYRLLSNSKSGQKYANINTKWTDFKRKQVYLPFPAIKGYATRERKIAREKS